MSGLQVHMMLNPLFDMDQSPLSGETYTMKSFARTSAILTFALTATVATTTAAHAASFLLTPTSQGKIGSDGAVTNVSNTFYSGSNLGYNFVYNSASSSKTPGAEGVAMDNNTATDAGLTAGAGTGILALDADYQESAVDITLTGLSASTAYTLTFDFAEDQQLWSGIAPGNDPGSCGNSGGVYCDTAFQSGIKVADGGTVGTLGAAGSALTVAGVGEAAQGFGPWVTETITFTSSASGQEVLSFLATAPSNQAQVPAFSLIDNINYSPTNPSTTPEPSSLMLLGTGLAGLSGFVRSRFKKS